MVRRRLVPSLEFDLDTFRRCMKKYLIILVFLFPSCAVVTRTMQTAEVFTPTIEQPIRITDERSSNSVIMRPTFYLSQKEFIGLNTGTHTKVNEEGVYELEPVPGQDYYIESDSVNIYEYWE